MKPDSPTVAFAKTFGTAIVAGDFAAAEAMLAPWIIPQLSGGSLKKFLRRAREDRPRPHSFDVSENTTVTLETLREDLQETGQITEENFRAWLCLEFYPDPELVAAVDLSYILWIAVVALEKDLAIGYLKLDA